MAILVSGERKLSRRRRDYSFYGYDEACQDRADLTGVPDGVSLTPVTYSGGHMVITGSSSLNTYGIPFTGGGTVLNPWIIDAVDLSITAGILDIQVDHLITYRSAVHTGWFGSGSTGVIKCTSTSLSHAWDAFQTVQCDIYADIPSYQHSGIIGHGWTADRPNVYHVSDGFGGQVASGVNVYTRLLDPWVHDLVFFENDGGAHADGAHSDCWQPQGGAWAELRGGLLDARYDYRVDGTGATPWMRATSADLTTAAGNGRSIYGTHNSNAAIQFNNNQAGAPSDNYTVDDVFFRGGRFSTVNYGGSAANGLYAGHTLTNCVFYTPAGYEASVWQSGDTTQSSSPGYPISQTQNYGTNITNGGNTMAADGTATPWRASSATVLRTG